ncbi:hypothetical protein [Nocardia sp. NPDC049149]|uniref:hypothetical protein n=1 Tax=Nocardia sp. NPDC049149 TaxID=3364315 RepID=UPI00371F3C16
MYRNRIVALLGGAVLAGATVLVVSAPANATPKPNCQTQITAGDGENAAAVAARGGVDLPKVMDLNVDLDANAPLAAGTAVCIA